MRIRDSLTIDDKYNAAKREREKEIDQILSKMGKNGLADLSEKDRERPVSYTHLDVYKRQLLWCSL